MDANRPGLSRWLREGSAGHPLTWCLPRGPSRDHDDVLTSAKHFKVAKRAFRRCFPVCTPWASSLPVAFTQILFEQLES